MFSPDKRKEGYDHDKSLANRRTIRRGLTAMELDIQSVETFGLYEQFIWGQEWYEQGSVHVEQRIGVDQYIPKDPRLKHPSSLAFFGYVDSRDARKKKLFRKPKVEQYPLTITLEKTRQDDNTVVYRAQDTADIPHQCGFTVVEELKKFMRFPCCAHRIAAMCWVVDKLPKILEEADRGHIEISTFYTDYNLLPVDQDIRDYYSTIRHLKSAERKLKLYEYALGSKRVFRSPDLDQTP